MDEPNNSSEQEPDTLGDKLVEAVGTVLGIGLFLLMLWLFGDLFWNPRLSIIDWLF